MDKYGMSPFLGKGMPCMHQEKGIVDLHEEEARSSHTE